MSGPAPRVERQVRRCLIAFPWRDRLERGEEIVGTVVDGLPDDAGRLPWPIAMDLVRGGLRTRRQRRPPWSTRMAYRWGSRLDRRWLRWLIDRLDHPHHVRHARLRKVAGAAVVFAWLVLTAPGWILAVAAPTGLALVGVGVWLVPWERDRARRRHGLVPGGIDPGMVWVQRQVGGRVRADVVDAGWAHLFTPLDPPASGDDRASESGPSETH